MIIINISCRQQEYIFSLVCFLNSDRDYSYWNNPDIDSYLRFYRQDLDGVSMDIPYVVWKCQDNQNDYGYETAYITVIWWVKNVLCTFLLSSSLCRDFLFLSIVFKLNYPIQHVITGILYCTVQVNVTLNLHICLNSVTNYSKVRTRTQKLILPDYQQVLNIKGTNKIKQPQERRLKRY